LGSSRTTVVAGETGDAGEEDVVRVNEDWVEGVGGTAAAWEPCGVAVLEELLSSSKFKVDSTELQERKSRNATKSTPTPRAISRDGWMNAEAFRRCLISRV
jgi:hypothetical protein